MQMNFEVIQHSNGYYPSLNIQIIPLDLEQNSNLENSIVINELAFSLVERFFFDNEVPYAHWGTTFFNSEKIIIIIEKLKNYQSYLNSKKNLTYKDDIQLLFKKETKLFRKKFPRYKAKIINMIDQIIHYLEYIQNSKINGITIIGI
ncbi:hypothetical protein D9M71_13920 [compost metagenome]